VIKPANSKPKIFRGDKLNSGWSAGRSDDRALVEAIAQELDQYDIWIAHNGNKFDIPFLRTRLLRWELPTLANKKLIDPVLLARNKLRMSYNSLEQIANHLGCNTKTEVRPEVWLAASLDGSTKAMDYIVKHCVQDVLVLEQIVTKLKHLITGNINNFGSGY
jgi:uncharacterized protein YprB with RNaseH-like and TPR domain